MYNLVKKAVEFEMSSDAFTETFNSLIENESVIVSTIVNVYHYQKKIFGILKLKRKISRNNFINLKMTF